VNDGYLKHKVIESLKRNKFSENYREFIGLSKRSDDQTDEFLQELKAEALALRKQKEEKVPQQKRKQTFQVLQHLCKTLNQRRT
jgi:hypothetical protein